MLAEGDVAVDERGFDGREFASVPRSFLAEEFVDRAGARAARNMPLASTQPSPSVAPPLMKTGRGAHKSDEFVRSRRADRLGVERAVVLEEVAGHPVVFAGAGDVFHLFAAIAAIDFRAAFAGRADVGDGEARVVGHGDERRFAVARVAFDADLLGVHGFIGLEIIEARLAPQAQARSAPQSSSLRGWPLLTRPMMPCVRPSPLSAWTLVGMIDRVAPAFGEDLLLPRGAVPMIAWPLLGVALGACASMTSLLKANSMHDGHGPVALAGVET